MKKILSLFAVIALLMTSCQREELPEPIPVATTVTPNGSGGTTVAAPPSSGSKFLVGIMANYAYGGNGYAVSELIPIVEVNGIPLDFVQVTGNRGNVYVDNVFEYDAPSSLVVNCLDVIDYSITINGTREGYWLNNIEFYFDTMDVNRTNNISRNAGDIHIIDTTLVMNFTDKLVFCL